MTGRETRSWENLDAEKAGEADHCFAGFKFVNTDYSFLIIADF